MLGSRVCLPRTHKYVNNIFLQTVSMLKLRKKSARLESCLPQRNKGETTRHALLIKAEAETDKVRRHR